MKTKLLILSSVVALLSGCASTVPSQTDAVGYNPQDSARIRLFGQNGKPSIMVTEKEGKPVKVNVGGDLGDAFSSFVGTAKNGSIGMAETENTANLASKDLALSKAFYREFVIPAGQPVRVQNAFIGLSAVQHMPAAGVTVMHQQASCTSGTVTFTPEAGKDYEVGSYRSGRACSVMVFEIQAVDGKTQLVPVPTRF